MQYEVTIGIPVYHSVDYIEETMLSALSQTFHNIEYLVIDDCGEDGSIEIIEQIQSEHPRGKDIRILYNVQNKGVGITRNRIIDEARGHYLFFLDSDDIIEPDTIQLLFDKAKRYQAEIVYGSLVRIEKFKDSSTQYYVLPDVCLLNEDEMAFYAFRNYRTFQISACNCLMNLDFVRKNHLRFIDAAFWEDMVFTYEMVVKVSRAILLSTVTYHYVCHLGSLSHYQNREKLTKDEILQNVSTIDYLKEKCIDLKDKDYFPYLCKDLVMNSFYIVCYVMKNSHLIAPRFTDKEMQNVLRHPLSLIEIMSFRHLLFENLALKLLSCLPLLFFKPAIWILGRLKGQFDKK